jgi:hypothetical protein
MFVVDRVQVLSQANFLQLMEANPALAAEMKKLSRQRQGLRALKHLLVAKPTFLARVILLQVASTSARSRWFGASPLWSSDRTAAARCGLPSPSQF